MQKEYIRLLTYLGDKEAPGIIRVMLPYMLLNQYDDVLANYDFVLHNEESFYRNLSILQVQRQCTPTQLNLIKSVKERFKNNIKIFYDIDDWILGIPKYNPTYEYYKNFSENVIQILKYCDCIICSTSELASYMSKFGKTKIIKNRLIRGLWECDNKYLEIPEKPIILWAGGTQHFSSNSEEGDFSNAIIEYIEKTTDKYCWTFVGSLPLKLKDNKNIVFYPWCNYFDYPSLLKKINPYIGLAVLENSIFNKCKSNIKALEYTSLNIPGVYSNLSPYRTMSCKFNNIDEFIFYIEKLCSDFDYYNSIKEKDYNVLKDMLYWDDLYVKQYLKTYLK